MTMARPAEPTILPLLVWHERSEIDRLQTERNSLTTRIMALRPHSHRRVELEARLRDVTARQIALQVSVERR